MDGVKRHERKKEETALEELNEELDMSEISSDETKKERRSFLDKLTERVKDFLDNAE
jgi:cell division protein FtsA